MKQVAIIDYGMGNLRSVANAVAYVDPTVAVTITQQADDILQADRVIFPGQGAIRDCMRELTRLQLLDVIRQVARNKPFLGVCLGPQALFESSEENGGVAGLGILPGVVRRFTDLRDPDTGERLKVPHMGWNQVYQVASPHPLWQAIAQDSRFYFVHSYYLQPADPHLIVAETTYGFPFASAIARDNLFAVQFHPEKSAPVGLQLLRNFIAWSP